MKTPKRELICGQSLEEIRQELSQVELYEVPDEEYIALLTRHTSNLLELVERLNLNTDSYEGIASTFSFLFGNLTEPVCVVDEKLKVLYNNACWNIKYGHLRSISKENNYFNGINKDVIRQSIAACQKDGKRKIVTLKSDASKHLISVMPFDGLDKGICFMLFSISDGFVQEKKSGTDSVELSSRKKKNTGEKLLDQTALSYTLLEAVDGFYFSIDVNLIIKTISSSVQKKLGYSSSELINKSLALILSEKSLLNVRNAIEKRVKLPDKERVQTYRNEVEILDTRQELHLYDLTLTCVPGSYLFAGICIDIQQYKDREQELVHAKVNAELNDKLKSDFLANMSHEIRTPLNGIVGFATMLNRNHLDQTKREKYLRIIRASTLQLLTLVSDIIDISKIEAGQLKIHYTKVDVNQILEDLQATFVAEAQRLGKKEIKLIKQTGRPRSKLFIKSDEVRLKQVLNNLLGNALKFTEKGEITFGYSLSSCDSIRFFVKDSGIGISKSEQKSIFNRFKQSREGMKNIYKGTGLGLAISKGIVELMGGSIGVTSLPGAGAEFSFEMPLTEG